MSEDLTKAFSDLQEEAVLKLVRQRVARGDDPRTIVADCQEGFARLGQRYQAREYDVSDLIRAAEIFKQALVSIPGTIKAH